jgi:hypothetical protein
MDLGFGRKHLTKKYLTWVVIESYEIFSTKYTIIPGNQFKKVPLDLGVKRHFFVRQKTKKRTKLQQILPDLTIYNGIQDFRIKRKGYFLSERRKNSIEHESRHIMIL